jgi:hypothetical protein
VQYYYLNKKSVAFKEAYKKLGTEKKERKRKQELEKATA